MKTSKLIIAMSLALFAVTAQAGVEAPGISSLTAPINVGMLDGIYQAQADFTFVPASYSVLGQSSQNRDQQTYTLPKGQPFEVEIKGQKALLHPIVNADQVGNEPDVLVLSRADLEKAGLQYLSNGDKYDLYANYTSTTPEEFAGRCKFYVERHFHFHTDGLCASTMSAGKLARVGFYRTSCGSAQLQVWGGGYGGCGHVAWRAGRTWSSGDYVGDPGHRYYSLGCYARNGNGAKVGRSVKRTRRASEDDDNGVYGLISGGDGNG